MALGGKIKDARTRAGMTQEQVAESLGVSRQTISNWETGLSSPGLEKFKALSELFHVSIDELTGTPTAAAPHRPAKADSPPAAHKIGVHKIGLCLCLAGAVCLLASGLLMIFQPAAASRISESAAITLDGTGILIALFVLMMLLGIALLLKGDN